MKKVYVATKGLTRDNSEVVLDILGIFENEDSAIKRCLNERSLVSTGWISQPNRKNHWENGSGLYVNVNKFTVE